MGDRGTTVTTVQGGLRGRALRALAVMGMLAFVLLAIPGHAQAQTVELEVTVAQIFDAPGPIDPKGARIHEKLTREFRYGSLTVVDSKRMKLGLNEVGKLKLPNGKTVTLVPMLLDDRGVLMAVDVEGVLKTDLRVKSGHLVVFGAHRHGDGKLVIAVTPRF